MNLDTLIAQLIAAHQALSEQQRPLFVSRLVELIHDTNTSEPSSSPSSIPESDHPGLLLSDIPPQQVQWLWPDRLPLGHLTVLEGASGLGTSLFSLTLAAAVSSGAPLFTGPACPQGHVLLLTPGLHHAGLLRQRLEAAGADLTRITLLSTIAPPDPPHTILTQTPFTLPAHFSILEDTIARLSPALVIIDPLALAVRSSRLLPDLLSQLAALAERANCALLLVRHLPASRTSALTAHASTILRLAEAPGEDHERLLTTLKHTLSPASPALLLQISGPPPNLPAFRFVAELPPASPDSGELSRQRQRILHALQVSPQPLTPHDLARRTGLPYDPLRLLLSRMTAAGDIRRPARGLYTSLHPPCPPTSPAPHHSGPSLISSAPADPFAAILASSRQQMLDQTTSPDTAAPIPARDTRDPSAISAPSSRPNSRARTDTTDTIAATNPTHLTGAPDPSDAHGSTDTPDPPDTYTFVTHFPPVQPGPHYPPSFPDPSE